MCVCACTVDPTMKCIMLDCQRYHCLTFFYKGADTLNRKLSGNQLPRRLYSRASHTMLTVMTPIVRF